MLPRYYVGTSGWHYDHWRWVFYPPELPKNRWLTFYAQHFSTVELNNSFYRLPSQQAFAAWRDNTPLDFVFSVKVCRLITHLKKLRQVQEPLANLLDRASALGDKLGPLLYQLPPNLPCNRATLEAFVELLPKGLRHVFEFRHPSWFSHEVIGLLRRYSVGFCIMDLVGLGCPLAVTAEYAYVRFHGPAGPYWGSYSDEQLSVWKQKISSLAAEAKEVYIYFNNDMEGYAVQNARRLGEMLVVGPK